MSINVRNFLPDRYGHTAHLEELSITEKEHAFKIIGND